MSTSSWRAWRVPGRARTRERFARAIDSTTRSGGPSDPKLAGELAIVSMLRTAAPDLEQIRPDQEARARMRERVMSGVARMPATGTSGNRAPRPAPLTSPRPTPRTATRTTLPTTPRTAPLTRPRTSGPRGRLLVVIAAAFCLILALGGMAMLVSRNALPGDPLYGVRRTVESATLGLTMGTEAKGLRHLEFAADRITDLEALAATFPDPRIGPVNNYLTGFRDFDADAAAGSADLTDFAASNSPAVLSTLRDWASSQLARINAVGPAVPAPARTSQAGSVALLGRIGQRAAALLARTACYTVTSGATDDIGVLPASGTCDRVPTTSGTVAGPQTTGPGQSGQPGSGGSGGTGSRSGGGGGSAGVPVTTPGGTGGGGGAGPTVGTGPLPLPSIGLSPSVQLPLPIPSITLGPLVPGLPGVRVGG